MDNLMETKEKLEEQLALLKEKRKEYEIKAENCDVLQIALKLVLNSAYGAFGSVYYPLYDIDIAESTTIGGKTATLEMVKYVNQYMNKLQGTENEEFIVAGDTDSVFSSAKVSIDGKTIKELYDKYNLIIKHKIIRKNDINPNYWTEIIDLEEYCKNNKIENTEYTYSLNGKTKIKNITRHKVNKEKYKITIDNNILEITGDHSIMIYRDGKVIECKPGEIKNTDYLLLKNK